MMIRLLHFLKRSAYVICVMAALAPPLSGESIRATPVYLDEENIDRTTVDGLTWRGGLALESSDRRFGGLSALRVSADGRRLTAVTDRGHWVHAALEYRNGNLSGIRDLRIQPILDPEGEPVAWPRTDAESLAADGLNGLLVSFERDHRIWRYRDPAAAAARPLEPNRALRRLPKNGGIEAMTRLCDGRLLTVAEQSRTLKGAVGAWIRSKAGWREMRYRTLSALRPTAAATLPDCDVIFVERSFSLVAGLDIRLTRVPAASIEPGARLLPREIARLSLPITIDNFEGISARRDGTGDTLIYLISDDNFSPLQRTLLVMFRLNEAQ